MSGLEALQARDLAVIASCLISALAFWRTMRRDAAQELRAATELIARLDNRLQALERHAAAAPTIQQFSELMGGLQVLDARLTGRIDTLAARIEHGEGRHESVSLTVQRIEGYLLERGGK